MSFSGRLRSPYQAIPILAGAIIIYSKGNHTPLRRLQKHHLFCADCHVSPKWYFTRCAAKIMAGMAKISEEPARMNPTIRQHISPETVPANGHQRASRLCSIALTVITPKLIHANTMFARSRNPVRNRNGWSYNFVKATEIRTLNKKEKNKAGMETTHPIAYSVDKNIFGIRTND